MTVVVAVDGRRGRGIIDRLRRGGLEAVGVRTGSRGARIEDDPALTDAVAIVVSAARSVVDDRFVAACDASGLRIVVLDDAEGAASLCAAFGLGEPVDPDASVAELTATISAADVSAVEPASAEHGQVVVVWGPHGAPGRSTVATEIAAELSRGQGRVALVDADAHAPSLALSLGIADEGPGFPAACRQADLDRLDAAELTRISTPVRCAGGEVRVLAGLNRPGRWPELRAERVRAALNACRTWARHTVVDVAAPLERDEEIVSDIDGPRRNAATLAALDSADVVVAVLSAEPVGVARFLRDYAELRAVIGATRVVVIANRMRPGTLGVDARGQVRHALERFAGVDDVWFLPMDPRSVDAAVLRSRPVADVAGRSPLAAAVRRIVGETLAPPPTPVTAESRRRRRDRAHAAGAPRSAGVLRRA